ncbi:MAG TPA: hypothetical protein DDW65_06875 [Firmicutes bacterium]|jgi:hypothetical protein|nr:hypothetical protein [Bacillota bacterium]
MHNSAISCEPHNLHIQKETPQAKKAEYNNEIKTLKKFEALLDKEVKLIGKSKMDSETKREAIEAVTMEKRSADAQIHQLNYAKAALSNHKRDHHSPYQQCDHLPFINSAPADREITLVRRVSYWG